MVLLRYHLNRETGEVGQCKAEQKCPFGDLVDEHFDTPESARHQFEQMAETHWGLFYSKDENHYEENETYEDEYGREWIYSSSPSVPDGTRPEQELAKAYWAERFPRWTTGWLNPDEANGLCTDSAEAFTVWANARGEHSYVLDLNRDGGPHTVSVIVTDDGPMVVDFTYRQFDNESPVPYFSTEADFVAEGDWEITQTYIPTWVD